MASGGHISETTEPAVVLLLLRVRKSRRNSVLANGEVHLRPESFRFRGTWNWYPFGIGARLRWVPDWAGYPFGLGTLGGALSTRLGLGLQSVQGGYLNRLLPIWGGYTLGVRTCLGRVSVSGGTSTPLDRESVSGGTGTSLGLPHVCGSNPLGSYPRRISTRLASVPALGLYPFGVDTRLGLVHVPGSIPRENSVMTKPISLETPLFNTYLRYIRIPIEVPSSGFRYTPIRCIPEVALIPSPQGVLL